MKKLLLLFLCTLSYNTAWTSFETSSAASSQSSTNAAQSKKILVTYRHWVYSNNPLHSRKSITASDDKEPTNKDKPDQTAEYLELYRRKEGKKITKGYSSITPIIENGKWDGCSFGPPQKPNNPLFVKAIHLVSNEVIRRNLHHPNMESIWLVEGNEAKLAEFKNKTITKEIFKSFPDKPLSVRSLGNKCITCREARRERLRNWGETPDCDMFPDLDQDDGYNY